MATRRTCNSTASSHWSPKSYENLYSEVLVEQQELHLEEDHDVALGHFTKYLIVNSDVQGESVQEYEHVIAPWLRRVQDASVVDQIVLLLTKIQRFWTKGTIIPRHQPQVLAPTERAGEPALLVNGCRVVFNRRFSFHEFFCVCDPALRRGSYGGGAAAVVAHRRMALPRQRRSQYDASTRW